MNENSDIKINCYQCKHFYITWDKRFPKGCKCFGFKTARMPSQTVFEATGEACNGFVNKSSL